MKYEKPEIIDFKWAEAMGLCATGSGDATTCSDGNNAGSSCSGGNSAGSGCNAGAGF